MGEYQKVLDFLTSFLCDFDFILPKGKLNFEPNKIIEKKQYYLVPLLFPYKKPKDITLCNGKIYEFKRDHEWTIQYILVTKNFLFIIYLFFKSHLNLLQFGKFCF